jgi:hypothetical protein
VKSSSGLRRIEQAAFEMVLRMPGMVERQSLLQRLAQRLAVSPQAVKGDFESYESRERARGSRPAEPDAGTAPAAAAPPPPPEEAMLLEHLAADPELLPLAEAYAPLFLFGHPLCKRLLESMLASRKRDEDWMASLTAGAARGDGLMELASAIQMAPSKAGTHEFSREDAVKALILRLWTRHLKARKADMQRQAAAGTEVDPRFYQLTGDIKALHNWDEGLAIIESHLEEPG